jgi:hypothetical protein
MKFDDLQFHPHKLGQGRHVTYKFPNGWGVSIVTGCDWFYCSSNTYEVAILKDGHLCYDTELTESVLADQTPEDIQKILDTIEKWEFVK